MEFVTDHFFAFKDVFDEWTDNPMMFKLETGLSIEEFRSLLQEPEIIRLRFLHKRKSRNSFEDQLLFFLSFTHKDKYLSSACDQFKVWKWILFLIFSKKINHQKPKKKISVSTGSRIIHRWVGLLQIRTAKTKKERANLWHDKRQVWHVCQNSDDKMLIDAIIMKNLLLIYLFDLFSSIPCVARTSDFLSPVACRSKEEVLLGNGNPAI